MSAGDRKTLRCTSVIRAGASVTGIVDDGDRDFACGISPVCWWCECGFHADRAGGLYVGPSDVCIHLWALGSVKAGGQPGPVIREAI